MQNRKLFCSGVSFTGGFFCGDSLMQFFDVFVRQFDAADERLALAEAVAVGAAGDEQMEFLRDFQVALRHHGRMLRVKTFDAVQAGVHEVGNDVIGPVQARMRHDRQSAGLMNQLDAFERGHFGLGHPGGAAFFQETLKRLIQMFDQAGLAPARGRHAAGPGDLQLASAKTDSASSGMPSSFRARDHFADAVLADGLKFGDFGQQRLILRVEKIAENVDFRVLVFGGEFRAGR